MWTGRTAICTMRDELPRSGLIEDDIGARKCACRHGNVDMLYWMLVEGNLFMTSQVEKWRIAFTARTVGREGKTQQKSRLAQSGLPKNSAWQDPLAVWS